MARNRPYSTQSFEFDYPCFISAPQAWMIAERAYIRISILYRASEVGILDISKYIPREFSGYYYLIKSGAVINAKPIEYRHQEVYFDRHIWTAETTVQATSSDLSTVDIDMDNIDESTRLMGFAGGALLDLITSLDIPFLDFGYESIQDMIDAVASDDLYYFPSPDRPNKIGFSIPDGLVNMRCEFGWIPYSKLMVVGGIGELPLQNYIEVVEPEELAGLGTTSDIKTFDEIAKDKGYIDSSGLPAACGSAGYLDNAASTMNHALNSSLNPEELLEELIKNGDILQSDIDAILAENPALTPNGIILELIKQGKITKEKIGAATASRYAEKPTNPSVDSIANIAGNPYKRWKIQYRVADPDGGIGGLLIGYMWSYHQPEFYVLVGKFTGGSYYSALVSNAIFHSSGSAIVLETGTRMIAANQTATTPTANPFIGKVFLNYIAINNPRAMQYSYSIVDISLA